ncbi:proteoglycan 4b isoform X2 [Vanacampus margaritifer]
MSPTPLCSLILLVCALSPILSQKTDSCRGRCGNQYYRGYMCQCDYNCVAYGECCLDFESQCTTKETVNEAEQPSVALSGANDEDNNDVLLVSPTSFPQDDANDATPTETIPSDDHSDTADPEESQTPESISGYGPSEAEPLDAVSTQATVITDAPQARTETVPLATTPSEDEVNFSTMADGVTSTERAETTSSQVTTKAEQVSNQPSPTSEPSPTVVTTMQETASRAQTDSQTEDGTPSFSTAVPNVAATSEPTNELSTTLAPQESSTSSVPPPEPSEYSTSSVPPPEPSQESSTSSVLPSEPSQESSTSSVVTSEPSQESSTSSVPPQEPSESFTSSVPSQESSTSSVPPQEPSESSISSVPPQEPSESSTSSVPPQEPSESFTSSVPSQESSTSSVPPQEPSESSTSSVPPQEPSESSTSSVPQEPSQESSTSSVPPSEPSQESSTSSVPPPEPSQVSSTPALPSEPTQESSTPSERSQESATTSPPQHPTQDSYTDAESSEAPILTDLTTVPQSITTTSVVTTGHPSSPPDLKNSPASVSPVGSDLDDTTTVNPLLTDASQSDSTDEVTQAEPSTAPVTETQKPTSPESPETTTKPQDKPNPSGPLITVSVDKPAFKPETKPVDAVLTVDSSREYQADDSNDTNLCNGRPANAVTTLRNGTIAAFRGHYYWFLDRNRVPGPAREITQAWGVPSPIDTVFTRCNCQGKTYIFKGNQYWRFENNNLDPGYPKVVETGFDGLQGRITAALSVPQYRRRRESVYFFKTGGLVQKYSYQFGSSPSCNRKPSFAIYTVRNRVMRQAVSLLGPTVNIRTAWRGFPTTVTSAVSVPSYREPEGYKYYVFSRTKSYNIRMDGDRPVVTPPRENPSAQNNNLINCPKTL